ncbi:hypothetical protein BKA56DRAFT_597601 [Ilyonectria sp. MPI-CAGE-AT-0026]|nr:hypothetical protein BKA56DRAFT_597601 [Ilyonectria sp. MPI-CAGE-AT-0026]
MAEIVGVVASVVALSKCCVGAFKAIDGIRQAPALFQNLQEEAHLFQEVLREVNNAVGDSPTGAVHEILLKAQKVMLDLI